jgi:hypothetical protein
MIPYDPQFVKAERGNISLCVCQSYVIRKFRRELQIIDSQHKMFYYRGLAEYKNEKGYLRDTCLSAQDEYAQLAKHFIGNREREYMS